MKKNRVYKLFLSFFFVGVASISNAQEVQNKIFISNGNFHYPQTEGRVASFCFESIDSMYSNKMTCKELAIGLLSIANDYVKYTIRDGEIIAPSFIQVRGNYRGETTITASKPSEMRSFDDKNVLNQIEFFNGTTHDSFNVTLINGTPIKEAVFANQFKELIFDFAVDQKGDLLCFLVIGWSAGTNNQTLKIWKLLDGEEKIIKWGEWSEGTDWTKLISEPELIQTISLPDNMEDITVFYLRKSAFVFNSNSGKLYQLMGSKLESISTGLGDRNFHVNSTLVIDKDNEKVFLLPKSVIKKEQMSFREMIEKHGIEIPLPK